MLNLPKLYKISLISIVLSFLSCNNTQKSYFNTISIKESIEKESKINFQSVALLNETNKKIIDIASIAFTNSNELNESKIILKIKRDHQKIESDLKKLTDLNLIIIPNLFFELSLNEKSLKSLNSSYYLISLLEKEINNQINLLDSIEKVSEDEAFHIFVEKSKNTLLVNSKVLENFL